MRINYWDTPQERRNNPFQVKWMSYLLGFNKKKKVEKEPRIEENSKYEHEPIQSNLYKHENRE